MSAPQASSIQLAMVKRLNVLEEQCEHRLSPSLYALIHKQNQEAIDRLFDQGDSFAVLRAIESMQDRLDRTSH